MQFCPPYPGAQPEQLPPHGSSHRHENFVGSSAYEMHVPLWGQMFGFSRQIESSVSQLTPIYGSLHRQMKPFTLSTHVPPLRQLANLQSSMFVSQSLPLKPCLQLHLKSLMRSSQYSVPFMLQGLGRHSLISTPQSGGDHPGLQLQE